MGQNRGVAHGICNLKYSVPKKIPIVFHNGSSYDYCFIINKFKGILKIIYLFRRKHSSNRKRSYKNW